MIELNDQQQQGLETVLSRYRRGELFSVIAGYAGTGKSTLVRFIIEALGIPEESVCYCAYTGKATQVLQRKGNQNVSTLHKLLYNSTLMPSGRYMFKPKEIGTVPYGLLVVDEVSMPPMSTMKLLASHGIHTICLGDPFQLPPINKTEDNLLLNNPHVFLTDIMRQESESEIIQLSMAIRNGDIIPYSRGKDVMVIPDEELVTGMYTWADQILSATNATRIGINNLMREMAGRGPDPEPGDKIICLNNYWDDVTSQGSALINGTVGTLVAPFETYYQYPAYIYPKMRVPIISGEFISDTGENYGRLEMDKNFFINGGGSLTPQELYKLKSSKKFKNSVPYDFTYGYAITCHKAQGSSWGKVLVMEEKFPFNKEEHARWLYTAVTRAEDQIILRKAK